MLPLTSLPSEDLALWITPQQLAYGGITIYLSDGKPTEDKKVPLHQIPHTLVIKRIKGTLHPKDESIIVP